MKSGSSFYSCFSPKANILLKNIIEKSEVKWFLLPVTNGFVKYSIVVKDSSLLFKMDKWRSEQASSFHITQ